MAIFLRGKIQQTLKEIFFITSEQIDKQIQWNILKMLNVHDVQGYESFLKINF